ncbi:UDP-glucose 4-epimerase [Planctomycetaceae bacterium]|nr:UDP-glucose 4-epimerase [Planctomycetaceae bacterium]
MGSGGFSVDARGVNTRTVLVTGAAGFIGRHLCATLLARGDSVLGVDNFSASAREGLPAHPKFTLDDADVADEAQCLRLCRNVRAIVHLAAFSSVPRSLADPAQAQRDTEQSTLSLLRAASDRLVARFVLASSSSVYGDTKELPVREDATPAPKSPYAQAKLASEVHLRQAAPKVDGVALRFFNLYGPGQRADSAYAAAVPIFAARILRGEPITIYGDGNQTRDFLYVSDAVDAILRALDARRAIAGAPVNIASGQAATINALIGLISSAAGKAPKVRHEPERRGDIRASHADIARARQWLAFEPRVALADGVARTVEWLRRFHV